MDMGYGGYYTMGSFLIGWSGQHEMMGVLTISNGGNHFLDGKPRS